MNINNLIIFYIIPIVAITYLIVYSKIFEPVRNLLSRIMFFKLLFDCPICVATWVGIGIGVLNVYEGYPDYIEKPFIGACSGICVFFFIELFLTKQEEE